MADTDDYELISRNDIRKLRDQLKSVDPTGATDMKALQRSLGELDEKLNTFLEVLNGAVEDMHEEDHESEIIKTKIDPIIEKLSQIDDQNKKLAQGMVAVNKLVDDKLDQLNELVKSLLQAQQELKESVKDALHEVKLSTLQSPPSFTPASASSGLDNHFDLGMPSSDKSLPPLPSSRPSLGADKKKFKLF